MLKKDKNYLLCFIKFKMMHVCIIFMKILSSYSKIQIQIAISILIIYQFYKSELNILNFC